MLRKIFRNVYVINKFSSFIIRILIWKIIFRFTEVSVWYNVIFNNIIIACVGCGYCYWFSAIPSAVSSIIENGQNKGTLL